MNGTLDLIKKQKTDRTENHLWQNNLSSFRNDFKSRNPYIKDWLGHLMFASKKPTKKIDSFPFGTCPDQKNQIQIV